MQQMGVEPESYAGGHVVGRCCPSPSVHLSTSQGCSALASRAEALALAGGPGLPVPQADVLPTGYRVLPASPQWGAPATLCLDTQTPWCVVSRARGARRPAPVSLSLFSSQDLKFNYISKEINFNVMLPMPVYSV